MNSRNTIEQVQSYIGIIGLISTSNLNVSMVAISVVMPVYNASPFLKESIQSILNQTFTNFELIIVDDGSTDDSLSIIRTFNDARIRLIVMGRNDYINSINVGMRLANGRYIARMDSDDIMESNRLDIQLNYLEHHRDIDVCGSWVETFGEESKVYTPYIDDIQLKTHLLYGNVLFNPTTMIRVDSLKRYYNFPENNIYNLNYPFAEDYYLWCDIVKKGGCLSNIPQVLLKYRCRERQQSTLNRREMMRQSLKIRLQFISWVIASLVPIDESGHIYRSLLMHPINKATLEDLVEFISREWNNYLISKQST